MGTHFWRLRLAALGVVLAAIVTEATAPRAVEPPVPRAAAPPAPRAEMARVVVGALTLEAPGGQRDLLDDLAREAATALPRLEADLGTRAAAPYRIVLIPPGRIEDPDITALDAMAPPWAAGFLIPARRAGGIRVGKAENYPYGDLASVLVHESAHMLLHDAAGENLPRWFGEGVATGEERAWGLRDILVYSSSLITGRLPPLADLDAAFEASASEARAAYAASFDFVSWARRRHGADVVRRILREARGRPFAVAWRAATGDTLERSESEWRSSSLWLYRWVPALTGTATLWTVITLLALLAAARRRARSREILERWDNESDGWE